MPPRKFSRFTFSTGFVNSDGRLALTEREPFRFREFSDNRRHVVNEGDTLFTLASRAYSALERPAGLWWVLADFQPEPIIDPTIKLAPGSVIVIPSIRTVIEEIFSEDRREG